MYRLLVIVISLGVSFNAYTGEQKNVCTKAFFDAIFNGDIFGFDLKADPELVHSRDNFQNTPLHHAALFSSNEIMVQLIEAGADVNARNITGVTPLLYTWKRNLEWLNILIKAGADVNAQDMHGTTALMVVAKNGSEDLVISLLKAGADPSIKNKKGDTAYCVAKNQGNVYIMKLLEDSKKFSCSNKM